LLPISLNQNPSAFEAHQENLSKLTLDFCVNIAQVLGGNVEFFEESQLSVHHFWFVCDRPALIKAHLLGENNFNANLKSGKL
jgi:hypothetical protein